MCEGLEINFSLKNLDYKEKSYMNITTHFGGSVVYILQQYYCQARLYSGEKIDRACYFHFLIRFCFAAASSMLTT